MNTRKRPPATLRLRPTTLLFGAVCLAALFCVLLPAPASALSLTAHQPPPGATSPDDPIAVSVFATSTVQIAPSQAFTIDGQPVAPLVSYYVLVPGYWHPDPWEEWWVDPVYDFTQATVIWSGTLTDGAHTAEATVTDVLAGAASTAWAFDVASPPVITAEQPVTGTAAPTLTPEVGVRVSENGASVSGTVTIDGEAHPGVWDPAREVLTFTPATPLADETWHEASAVVRDGIGLSAERSWRFYIRSQVPLRAHSPSPDATTPEMSPVVSLQASDTETIVGAQMWIDGILKTPTLTHPEASGHWEPVFEEDPIWVVDTWDLTRATASYQTYRLADGSHAATVTFTDTWGLTATMAWTFGVSHTPVVDSVQPAESGAVATDHPVVSAHVLDNDAHPSGAMTLDGSPVAATWNGSSYRYTPLTVLGDHTTHEVSVTLTDAAGNTSMKTWTFRVLLTPDTTFTPTPAPGATVGVWNPQVSCVVSDTVPLQFAEASMTLDGTRVAGPSSWSPDLRRMTMTYRPASLTDGPHTLRASVSNSIGQETSATWTLDVGAPPMLSNLVPSPDSIAETLTPMISADATENSPGALSFDVTVDGVPLASTYDTQDKRVSAHVVTPLSDDVTHTVRVVARDAASNASTTTWSFRCEQYPAMPIQTDCVACHAGYPVPDHPMDRECYACHAWIGIGHGSSSCGGGGDPMCHTDSPHAASSLSGYACATCHTPQNGNVHTYANLPSHEDVAFAAVCRRCHSSFLAREHARRTSPAGSPMTCASCHASTAPAVKEAIATGRTDCYACHPGYDHHRPSAIAGVLANGERPCTDCHATSLEAEHAKQTSSSSPDGCDACHAPGGARSRLVGAWDGRCDTPACHGASAARPMHARYCLGCHEPAADVSFASTKVDFAVAPVDRVRACPRCHWEPAGAHPYHNGKWNCGSCHSGMGATKPQAVPLVSTAGGWFNTTGSANADSTQLHLIHANPTWAGSVTKDGHQCRSCHAAAACTACHEGIVPTHGDHTWDEGTGDYWPGAGPAATVYGSGTSAGNEAELTLIEHLTCSALTCHTPPSGADSPFLVEDSSASVKYTGGGWGRSGTGGYTANSYYRSNYLGARAELTFTGERVDLISDTGPYRGNARIWIDGVPGATLDLYSASIQKQYLAYSSPVLPSGAHTITVEVLRQKNPAARDYYVVVDAFRVYPKATLRAAVCSACHAPDTFTGSPVDRRSDHRPQ